MASISARKKALTMGALECDFAELLADEESSCLEMEKQARESLEAQIALLQKEKEERKTELDQLRSEKEAAEKQFNELKSEKTAAEDEINRLKDKLGEAEGKVNELQMYKAAIECTRLCGAQLLPGIPDEITLDHICTKLPWSDFRSLSSVSHCWQEAIRSRRVYDARVQTQSTETLVCITRAPHYEVLTDISSIEEMKGMGFGAMLGLYSLIEDSCHQLPQIPNLRTRYLGAGGLPASCQCVSFDGKIYVLGGTDNPDVADWQRCGRAEVYVLDVARQRPWKQLASMEEARMDFAACVLDGKIYVFGGRSLYQPVYGSEVYDPEEDKWSPIAPMTTLRSRHRAAVIGEEVVVLDGVEYDLSNEEDAEIDEYEERIAGHFQVYHPAKNEWRRVENGCGSFDGTPIFTANGKAYAMDSVCISSFGGNDDVYSWTSQIENSFPGMGPGTPHSVLPGAAVAVNDEVLALVQVFFECVNSCISDEGTCLFQSRGFDKVGNKTGPDGGVRSLTWQKLNCSYPFEGMCNSGAMFLIQL